MNTKKINIEKTKNSFTGGHWAIRGANSKTAFQNPMTACKSIELFKSDVVVDIGAYVGEYSLYAAKYANKVIAYEAAPRTFDVLSMNKKENMILHNLAVVGNDASSAKLFISNGIGATNSIVKKKAQHIKVPAISYKTAVRAATVVKIDVEGAEYDYPIIQSNLRAIILEFHPVGKNWINKANQIMDNLKIAGFHSTTKIPSFKNGWDTNSAWSR